MNREVYFEAGLAANGGAGDVGAAEKCKGDGHAAVELVFAAGESLDLILAEALVVTALISAGMVVYGLLLVALGAISSGEVVNAFRQNTSPGLRD